MRLRDYQTNGHEAILAEFREHQSTLAVYPTGCGKTVLFAAVIKSFQPKRALVLAHREELIWQAREKIEQFTGLGCEIEMADLHASTSLFHKTPVVISTIQTQIAGNGENRRMQRFNPTDFGLVIVDEAHHATAESYKAVLKHYQQNPDLKILGVTATPDRADEEALGQVFQSVAADYEILDAVHDGWLVDITQQFIPIAGLDYSHIKTVAGDLNSGELSKVMESESNIAGVTQPTLEVMFGLPPHSLDQHAVPDWGAYLKSLGKPPRRTIVFTVSVAQAEACCNIFNRVWPGLSDWVCGETNKEKRRATLDNFSKGTVGCMCNCGVLTEGYDNPGVEVIVMARATKSRALYCLDSQTEVLTDHGWRSCDTIDALDKVAAFDPLIDAIRYCRIDGHVDRQTVFGETMYGISGPMLDVRVTNLHEMVIRYKRGRNRVIGQWTKVQAESLGRNFWVPCAGISDLPDAPISDSEIRFIGWFLTDGTLNPKNQQITITQGAHQPWLREIDNCLLGCGFKFGKATFKRRTQFKQSSDAVRWTVSRGIPRGRDKHLRGWGDLFPYIDKNISDALFGLSSRQFAVLLEAIHLGDGTKYDGQSWTRRNYHIASASQMFVDRLQWLCVVNGYASNASLQNYNKNPIWIVHIKPSRCRSIMVKSSDGRPVWGPRDMKEAERVWCVSNALGTLVTRRQGKVVIVGNSQMLGRSTRPLPGIVDTLDTKEGRREAIATSAKPFCRVIDFVGNSGKHKLVNSGDILGGKVSDAAIERAVAKALKDGKPIRMAKALDNAQAELEQERRQRAERARQQEEARKQHLVAKSDFRVVDVNPFDTLDIAPVKVRGWDSSRTITKKQRDLLLKQGINPDKLPYAQTRQLIGELFKRWNNKMCSFKQAKILKRYGLPTDVSRVQATQWLDKIASNHWRKPKDLAA